METGAHGGRGETVLIAGPLDRASPGGTGARSAGSALNMACPMPCFLGTDNCISSQEVQIIPEHPVSTGPYTFRRGVPLLPLAGI